MGNTLGEENYSREKHRARSSEVLEALISGITTLEEHLSKVTPTTPPDPGFTVCLLARRIRSKAHHYCDLEPDETLPTDASEKAIGALQDTIRILQGQFEVARDVEVQNNISLSIRSIQDHVTFLRALTEGGRERGTDLIDQKLLELQSNFR
ncbi:MAG: hypothetical protein CMO55_17045 [Verrucomicrobiales bacterium]|nr:hypothetical protein [Verrucomicrobiales bacterium]